MENTITQVLNIHLSIEDLTKVTITERTTE